MASMFDDLLGAALGDVFAVFGDAATWRPAGGGATIPCAVRRRSSAEAVAFGRAEARLDAELLIVRASEVAAPAAGDEVDLGVLTFRIISDPWRELDGAEWICEAAKVAAP